MLRINSIFLLGRLKIIFYEGLFLSFIAIDVILLGSIRICTSIAASHEILTHRLQLIILSFYQNLISFGNFDLIVFKWKTNSLGLFGFFQEITLLWWIVVIVDKVGQSSLKLSHFTINLMILLPKIEINKQTNMNILNLQDTSLEIIDHSGLCLLDLIWLDLLWSDLDFLEMLYSPLMGLQFLQVFLFKFSHFLFHDLVYFLHVSLMF